MFREERDLNGFQGCQGYFVDDMPDIDEIFESLDDNLFSISILKGVGGHNVRLSADGKVCLTNVDISINRPRVFVFQSTICVLCMKYRST